MKKSTMTAIAAYLNAQSNLSEEVATARDEINAELEKNAAKAQANRDLYSTAHDIVIAAMSEVPQTVADIYAAVEDELPEGFSKSKVQYALLHYWDSEVVKVENGKNAYTYRLA